jgi:competence protein ComEC
VGLLVGGCLWVATAVALAVTVHLGVVTWWLLVAVALALGSGAVGVRRGLARRWRVPLAVAALALVAGSAVVTWRAQPLLDGPVTPLVGSRAVIEADVLVSSDPRTREGRTSGSRRTDDAWQLDAALTSWTRAGSPRVQTDLPVLVITTRDVAGLLPGTRLHVTARVLGTDPMRGRAATLVAETVTVTAGPPAVQGIAGSVRSALRDSVADRPPDAAGLLPGLVVGDTSRVSADLDSAMRDSSLTHLVAVSGGNVAVVVMLALGAVRLVGVRRGRPQVMLVALAVACYVVLARPQPSVVRAAGMTAVVLLAVLVDARVRPLDALGASVGGLVLLDPFLAVSVGFAMSAAATAGLLVLAERRPRRAEGGPWWRRAWRAVVAVVLVSTAAQLAVAPLIVGIGGGVPVGGVVANLLAEPAVAPATSFGLLAGLVGVVWPALAALLAFPAAWAVGWIALVARTTADLAPPLPWPEGWSGAHSMLAVLVLGGGAAYLAHLRGGVLLRTFLVMAVVGGLLAPHRRSRCRSAPPGRRPGGGS